MITPRKSNSGMTLIEVVIAGGLFASVAMGVSFYLVFLSKSQTKQISRSAVAIIQQEIAQSLMNDRAWRKTLDHSSNASIFSCLTGSNFQDCSGKNSEEFSVLNQKSKVLTGGTNDGFSLNGERCPYSNTTNSKCPLKFVVTAEPLCRSSKCTNVILRLTGKLEIAANHNYRGRRAETMANPLQYNFWLIRQTFIPPKRDVFEASISFASGVPGGICRDPDPTKDDPRQPKTVTREGWEKTGHSLFGSITSLPEPPAPAPPTKNTIVLNTEGRRATWHCRVVSSVYGVGANYVEALFLWDGTWYMGSSTLAKNATLRGTSEYAAGIPPEVTPHLTSLSLSYPYSNPPAYPAPYSGPRPYPLPPMYSPPTYVPPQLPAPPALVYKPLLSSSNSLLEFVVDVKKYDSSSTDGHPKFQIQHYVASSPNLVYPQPIPIARPPKFPYPPAHCPSQCRPFCISPPCAITNLDPCPTSCDGFNPPCCPERMTLAPTPTPTPTPTSPPSNDPRYCLGRPTRPTVPVGQPREVYAKLRCERLDFNF